MNRSRAAQVAIGAALVTGAAGLVLVHPCASGGAMAAAYTACECRGIEWVISDATAADGPRRTACLGWVSARTCYQFRGGPEVPCSEQ